MRECTFENYTLDRVHAERHHLAEVYREWGVLYFPRLMQSDPALIAYRQDLHQLLLAQARKAALPESVASLTFTALMEKLVEADPKWLMPIYDIGTRPVKLLSGNLLKFDPRIQDISRTILGENALMATPSLSDTLLVHLPGEDFRKFDIPLHQDFPYLMQSAQQITYWCNFTASMADVGGMRVFPGTHKLGICKNYHDPNEGRYRAIVEHPQGIDAFPAMDIMGDEGTLVIQDALLLHGSLPNTSCHGVRLTQIFRYTNIATPESAAYDWQSAVHASRGISFEQVHPEYVVTPEAAKIS